MTDKGRQQTLRHDFAQNHLTGGLVYTDQKPEEINDVKLKFTC